MPTSHAIQVPSAQSKFIRRWSFFRPSQPCPAGAELKECWRLASLPFCSNEETELILYGENLQQSRYAFTSHLELCVDCAQSQMLRNQLATVAERAFARCPLTLLFAKLTGMAHRGDWEIAKAQPT